jgi:hypothetical protein
MVLNRRIQEDVGWVEQLGVELHFVLRVLRVAEHARHARIHVVEQMAVEEPVATFFVGKPLDRSFAHRWYIDGVLQRRAFALPIEQSEEVTVQMQRVVHHRVVDQFNA